MATTTLDAILQKVVDRLIATCGFSTESCFVALDRPDGPPPNPGTAANLFVVVYPGGGNFDQGLFAGGGAAQVTDDGHFSIEIFSPVLLDPGGHDWAFLAATGRGVILMFGSVLSSLTNPPFYPLDGGGFPLLREPMRPMIRNQPSREEEVIGSMILDMNCKFDWTV